MQTVEIDVDYYIELLENRREFCKQRLGWDCPDCVWDCLVQSIKDSGISKDYSHPKYVVDNLLINADYGDFDSYKKENETDEEFIKRVEDDVMAIFPDERIVIYSL